MVLLCWIAFHGVPVVFSTPCACVCLFGVSFLRLSSNSYLFPLKEMMSYIRAIT